MSVDELATQVGVSRQSIYDWEDEDVTPRKKQLDKLAEVLGVTVSDLFKEGSVENGTRVNKTDPGTDSRMIPFYDAVAIAGFGMVASTDPVDRPKHMINPGTFFRNAEGALQITGHSMFPKYPSGCIVGYRLSSKERILWGEDYVVELREDRRLILKRIEKSALKDCVKLVSYNVNKDNKYVYDPIDYPLDDIGRIFMVLGKIELEAMQT